MSDTLLPKYLPPDPLLYAQTAVMHHEGLRLLVYDDKTGKAIGPGDTLRGHPTIGWGRSLDLDGISPAEAAVLLQNSLMPRHLVLLRYDWYRALSAVRQAIVLDIAYNVGVAGVLNFSNMIRAIRAGDFDAAAREIIDSTLATRRAEELAGVMRTDTAAAWMLSVTG